MNQSSLRMCTRNYAQINKIMNFALQSHQLGMDYDPVFATGGMNAHSYLSR